MYIQYGLGLDDVFIVATIFAGLPSTVINTVGLTRNGLGQDVWTIPHDTVTEFVRWFYIQEILYFTQVPLLKLSILFFYLRVFNGGKIKKLLLYTVGVNCAYAVVFIAIGIFQCDPIRFYWEGWAKDIPGTCLDINALGWSHGVVSIVIDLWMLAIPLSQIRHLKLHWKKKIGVTLMFIVGTL
jgi:hypothetical protein